MNNNSENVFGWVDFYEEFADKLLRYKNKRKELITKVKKIFQITNINMPTLEKDNKIIDIDPFTVFGLFNKRTMSEENRIKIISETAHLFDIKAQQPFYLNSIPLLDNRNAIYYKFVNERGADDIDKLWEFFEDALDYSKDPTKDKRLKLSKCFDIIIRKNGIGNSKITMGLFFIAPNSFMNFDKRSHWYIYESGKIPEDVGLPNIDYDYKISAEEYFKVMEAVSKYLKSGRSIVKDFKELSFEAWKYSEAVNRGEADDNTEQFDDEIDCVPYTVENFLEEVYMDIESYDKLTALLKRKKNVILKGAPGVGKTFIAKRLAYSMMGVNDKNRVEMVQFHQNYSYEDFIMGFRPNEDGYFELRCGAFYNFCKKAEDDLNNHYFFIIDEINRGNISKIFGELFMLIENDKRGDKIRLMYSDEEFSVPENLYIIGMMNTADRSLAILDYALRRRFSFFEISPAFDTEGFKNYVQAFESLKLNKLINCVENLNDEITNDDTLGKGFRIGHSYFCNLEEAGDMTLSGIVEFELIPLLEEYWFDDPSKVEIWSDNLRRALN